MPNEDKVTTMMSQNLTALAREQGDVYQPTGRLSKSRTLSRADVIKTFDVAFQQIGGTSRLAVWADSNPGDFFKLYGRLLPTSSTTELDGETTMVVQHALPPPRNVNTGKDPEPKDG